MPKPTHSLSVAAHSITDCKVVDDLAFYYFFLANLMPADTGYTKDSENPQLFLNYNEESLKKYQDYMQKKEAEHIQEGAKKSQTIIFIENNLGELYSVCFLAIYIIIFFQVELDNNDDLAKKIAAKIQDDIKKFCPDIKVSLKECMENLIEYLVLLIISIMQRLQYQTKKSKDVFNKSYVDMLKTHFKSIFARFYEADKHDKIKNIHNIFKERYAFIAYKDGTSITEAIKKETESVLKLLDKIRFNINYINSLLIEPKLAFVYLVIYATYAADFWLLSLEPKAKTFLQNKLMFFSKKDLFTQTPLVLGAWMLPFPFNFITNIGIAANLIYRRIYHYPAFTSSALKNLAAQVINDQEKLPKAQKETFSMYEWAKRQNYYFDDARFLSSFRIYQLTIPLITNSKIFDMKETILSTHSSAEQTKKEVSTALPMILQEFLVEEPSAPGKPLRKSSGSGMKESFEPPKYVIDAPIATAVAPAPEKSLKRIIHGDAGFMGAFEIKEGASIPSELDERAKQYKKMNFLDLFCSGEFDKIVKAENNFGGFKWLNPSQYELKPSKNIGTRLIFNLQGNIVTKVLTENDIKEKSVPSYLYTGQFTTK